MVGRKILVAIALSLAASTVHAATNENLGTEEIAGVGAQRSPRIFEAAYLAFGEQGEYPRPAVRVGELPHEQVAPALRRAAANLGVPVIRFGVPIWRTLGMSKAQCTRDRRQWLRFCGDDLPLMYVNVYR